MSEVGNESSSDECPAVPTTFHEPSLDTRELGGALSVIQ